jgi:phosphoribosylaminoimidazole-succinocarboxamide synthase
VPNHLLPDQAAEFDRWGITDPDLRLRSMIVRKLRPLTIECVVRGYLVGSGWASYQESGQVCGHALPAGLEQAQELPEPLFTPTTKAAVGDHDEPINDVQGAEAIGAELYAQVKDISRRLYDYGRRTAAGAGIILADTKFEFGTDESGRLVLIDEVLTPDSSRYWPAEDYRTGISPPSYDKQFVRDFLTEIAWDRKPPAPALPAEIIERTRDLYLQAVRKLIG